MHLVITRQHDVVEVEIHRDTGRTRFGHGRKSGTAGMVAAP